MYKKWMYIAILLVTHKLLNATPLLNFHHLSNQNNSFLLNEYENQTIQIRGFLYPISEKEKILAPFPNLKNCCLKAPHQNQLIIKDLPANFSSQYAITLEGIFKIESVYNQSGELMQLFVLEQAKEVSKTHDYKIRIGLLILMIISVWMYFFFRKEKLILKK